MLLSRRQFLVGSAAGGTGLFLVSFVGGTRNVRAVPIPGAALKHPHVPPPLAPPAGLAAGAPDPAPGRPADRLLRDLDAAAGAADPAIRPAPHDGLGPRRGAAGGGAGGARRSRT